MEEERFLYIVDEYDPELTFIFDTNTEQKYFYLSPVCNLLNQQDKRIKELEEMNKKLDKRASRNFDAYMKCSKKYTKLLDENLQLKQSQKQLAIKEFERLLSKLSNIENTLINCGNGKEDAICWFVRLINDQIKSLKGEE